MENLFKINQLFIIFLITIFSIKATYAQASFIVHRVQGEPYLEVNDSIKQVTKGSLIDKKTVLKMSDNDVINYINDKGEMYQLNKTGSYNYVALKAMPVIKNQSSFIQNVFTYIWKELNNSVTTRNKKSGVVYRGEKLISKLYPAENSTIAANEMYFEWEPKEGKEKDYYFILRDISSGSSLTIGTPATSLKLSVDENILKYGNTYEWTIAETRFPPSDFPFSSFKVLLKDELNDSQQKIKEINYFLLKSGYSKDEVRKISCQDFKICY